MYRGGRRFRVFAFVWAVLQLALPAFATGADARLAAGARDGAHVEERSGRDCAPSHSADCVVCKHLSASALGSTSPAVGTLRDGRDGVVPGRAASAPHTLPGAALPRAPPTHG
jgi:hypothetical protein